MSRGNEYRLAIGNVVLSLACHPPGLADFFADWFGVPTSIKPANMALEFEVIAHDDVPLMPNSLLKTKIVQPDGSFDIANGLVRGSFEPNSKHGLIQAKGTLVKGLLPRILEQIFYQAYYSAPQTLRKNSFLVHSSAVIADGAATVCNSAFSRFRGSNK